MGINWIYLLSMFIYLSNIYIKNMCVYVCVLSELLYFKLTKDKLRQFQLETRKKNVLFKCTIIASQ